MPIVQAEISNVIKLDAEGIDDDTLQTVKDYLTIPNLEKEKALAQHLWNAEAMPDDVILYAESPRAPARKTAYTLILPRGIIVRLVSLLKERGYDLRVDDKTSFSTTNILENLTPISTLRDYQSEAVYTLLREAQGIYQCGTGGGKTVTMLELIRRAGQKSLVIVNRKELVQQWIDRSEKFLGFQPGFIGDNRWEEKSFTIAMQQTLHSKRDSLSEWWQEWGLVCLDECHAATAETYQEVLERFPAAYRYGLSATPKKTGDFRIAEAVLGPIAHVTPKKTLREGGYIEIPQAYIIPTGFHHHYQGTVVDEDGKVIQRTNYQQVTKALIRDEQRNRLITQVLSLNSSATNLLLSKRIEHLDSLINMARELNLCGGRIHKLTGDTSLEERQEIFRAADEGSCAIFSTLADEGLDVPRIDRLYLTYPTKNTDLIIQQIGRGERKHPNKSEFIIYDFVDSLVGPLKKQYQDRKLYVYRQEKIPFKKLLAKEIESATII